MESIDEKTENICPKTSEQICTFTFVASQLPSEFKHEITDASNDEEYIVRANLDTKDDILKWILEFGASTRTQWNFRRSRFGCQKIYKEYSCHHSSCMKQPRDENGCNKKGVSKNTGCLARIRISIKISPGKRAVKRDPFLKEGLWGTIRIGRLHTHPLKTATILRFLQDKSGALRETFLKYFENGMTAVTAKRHHERELELNEVSELDFANGSVNPTYQTIMHWYKLWRSCKLKPKSKSQSKPPEETERSDAKRCKLSDTNSSSRPDSMNLDSSQEPRRKEPQPVASASGHNRTAVFRAATSNLRSSSRSSDGKGNIKSINKTNTTITHPSTNLNLEKQLLSLRKIAPKPQPEEIKKSNEKQCKPSGAKSSSEIEPINIDPIQEKAPETRRSLPQRIKPQSVSSASEQKITAFQVAPSDFRIALCSSGGNTKSTNEANTMIAQPLTVVIPQIQYLFYVK